MKPLYLKLEGVNSFIEPQEIDFAALSAPGIFGISGATGSGKTTVLDCVIIALYGKTVGRGKHNADFINLKSEKARIEFTFSIFYQGRRQSFTSERIFTRRGGAKADDSVRHDAWLYVENDGGRELIEQGSAKVNDKLLDIVGLKSDDFCQCVVLQQGEFAKFLNLDKAKRIDMIGRIFSLEEYGERLNERLKGHIAGLNADIKAQEALKLRLGGVTAETVAGTRALVKELKARLKTQEAEKKRAQEAAAAHKTRLEKCAELIAKRAELEKKRAACRTLTDWIKESEAALSRLVAEKKQAQEAKLKESERVQKEYNALCERKAETDFELKAAEEKRDLVRSHNLAAAVSQNLHKGDLCPVCGAVVSTLPEHKTGDLERADAECQRLRTAAQKLARDIQGRLDAAKSLMEDRTAERIEEKEREKDAQLKLKNAEYQSLLGEGKQLAATVERLKTELNFEDADIAAVKGQAEEAARVAAAAEKEENLCRERLAKAEEQLLSAEKALEEAGVIKAELKRLTLKSDTALALQKLLKGRVLMEFVAEEQIYSFTHRASQTLSGLTNGRFLLKYNGEFLIQDNFSGGQLRSTGTLSGGETFLVSLSLALSISLAIANESDKFLEFFFMDEGFGTLDNDLIDTVMDSFEKLRHDNFTIGLISHRTELMQRIQSKITVEQASEFAGSRIVRG